MVCVARNGLESLHKNAPRLASVQAEEKILGRFEFASGGECASGGEIIRISVPSAALTHSGQNVARMRLIRSDAHCASAVDCVKQALLQFLNSVLTYCRIR